MPGHMWSRSIATIVAPVVLTFFSAAAHAQPSGPMPASSDNEHPSTQSPSLTEVVVTAEKREERLQDVPVPVAAVSAEQLTESNQVLLQNYFGSVPGLTVSPNAQSQELLSIRGVTTGVANPTVGVTIDGVPFGSSTNNGGGASVPDIDPSDLARIEVLRGPQGTLYGASSMGGLLNFVTVNPSTSGLSGQIQGGAQSIYNGASTGYSFRGSVNVPVSDTLAVRLSGFTREDPGYIDNPVLGIDGINQDHGHGGLLTALWLPLDGVSLKLSSLYQQIKSEGINDVDIESGLSGLQQDYPLGVGAYDRRAQAHSFTLVAKMGSVELTSVTGYNINEFSDSFDFSYAFGTTAQSMWGVSGVPEYNRNKTRKFSQEFRLTGGLGERLDWLLGAYYTHESSDYTQILDAENPLTGAIAAENIYFISFPTTFSEYAGFADLTVHVTDQFDIQIGGRESHTEESYSQALSEPLFDAPDLVVSPKSDASGNSFTYLFTPRLKLSPDLMLYARLASGYRAGGPNTSSAPGIPTQYNPDRTENYELGLKADFLDHVLSFDGSVYYIRWADLQISLISPTADLSYIANGGRAKSEGIELSAQVRPVRGLSISGWIALNNAKLTEDFPPASIASGGAYGLSGDTLPYASRFTGNLSVQDEFPLNEVVTGVVGGSVGYVSDRLGAFQPLSLEGAITPRQYYPSYAKTDVRAGLKYKSWSTILFVNNVANKRAVMIAGVDYIPPFAYQYIQPRTIGLNVTRSF